MTLCDYACTYGLMSGFYSFYLKFFFLIEFNAQWQASNEYKKVNPFHDTFSWKSFAKTNKSKMEIFMRIKLKDRKHFVRVLFSFNSYIIQNAFYLTASNTLRHKNINCIFHQCVCVWICFWFAFDLWICHVRCGKHQFNQNRETRSKCK